nr:hypothetical protein CFP56_65909 [Quercus suber]
MVFAAANPAELAELFARSRDVEGLKLPEAELEGRADDVVDGLVRVVGLLTLVRELTKGRLAGSAVALLVPKAEVLLDLSAVVSGRVVLEELKELVAVDSRAGLLFSSSSLPLSPAGFRAEAADGLVGGLVMVGPVARDDNALVLLEVVGPVADVRPEMLARDELEVVVVDFFESSLLLVPVTGVLRLSMRHGFVCDYSACLNRS